MFHNIENDVLLICEKNCDFSINTLNSSYMIPFLIEHNSLDINICFSKSLLVRIEESKIKRPLFEAIYFNNLCEFLTINTYKFDVLTIDFYHILNFE